LLCRAHQVGGRERRVGHAARVEPLGQLLGIKALDVAGRRAQHAPKRRVDMADLACLVEGDKAVGAECKKRRQLLGLCTQLPLCALASQVF
jgi:hypothetical protein